MSRHFQPVLGFVFAIAVSLAASPVSAHHIVGQSEIMHSVTPVAEQTPDLARRCIPGPHELGRVRRLPGVAATSASAWTYEPNVDAFPHCQDNS